MGCYTDIYVGQSMFRCHPLPPYVCIVSESEYTMIGINKNRNTVNAKILKLLQSGYDYTADQLRERFGIRDVGNRITELRKAGYAIYLNEKEIVSNFWPYEVRTIKAYRLGNPTRKQVAAGFALLNDPLLAEYRRYYFNDEINDNLALAK